MGAQPTTTPAIVTRGPGTWKVEDVQIDTNLQPREVLVEVTASGLCHTDLLFASLASEASASILGHEGAGYVRAVGSLVQDLSPGDAVLLSFASCTACRPCTTGHSSFCDNFNALNFALRRLPDMTTPFSTIGEPSVPLGGQYFGQSSFARLTVVNVSSVVRVSHLLSPDELEKFAPFGCGFQTGAGAIVNIAKAVPEDTVAVYGCGGVGLAAIMAAKVAGCQQIIAIDRIAERLKMAKTVGATHTLLSSEDIVQDVKTITGGNGTTISLECVGRLSVIEQALASTARRGTLVLVGAAPPTDVLQLPASEFMMTGKRIMGCTEGDSTPSTFLPQLIEWYRQGKFPTDQLLKFYHPKVILQAVKDMETGVVVKPVIRW